MRALILLADGFETVEALATYDIFARSHEIHPTLVSCQSDSRTATSSIGVLVEAELTLEEIKPEDYDILILPGGKIGVENLKANPKVKELITVFWNHPNKEVHAICAAPMILREMGLLNEKRYTCFPGFEGKEGTYTGEGVTADGSLITGKSMAYTIPFAMEIVKAHYGQDVLERIEKGTLGKA